MATINPSDGAPGSPVASVIIPCYGQAAFLAATIDSALGQSPSAVEVIVVDDASPDDTPAVAAAFGDRIRYVRQPNAGVAAARNTGLALARGAFVAFLDADDLLLPDMVQRHVAALREAGADVTCGGWRTIDRDGRVTAEEPPPAFGPDPFHALLAVNLAPPVCYLFRRSAVQGVGGFDPDRRLNGHEDWDLLLRLAAAGHRFATVPGATSAYRSYAGSSSRQHLRMYDTGHAVLAKTRAYHPPCPACGDRYDRAAAVLRDWHGWQALAPFLDGSAAWTGAAPVLRHLLRRARRDPRLIPVIARKAARRVAGRLLRAAYPAAFGRPRGPAAGTAAAPVGDR